MAKRSDPSGWNTLPPGPVESGNRLSHVRRCSDFAAGLLDRFPAWAEGAESHSPPAMEGLMAAVREHGLEAGLRRFRNREMLGIVWRDLCGLASLGNTFRDLTALAETRRDLVKKAIELENTYASALGDLAMRGEDGIRFFTQQKMVTERWPEPGRREGLNLVFPGN